METKEAERMREKGRNVILVEKGKDTRVAKRKS
jgi:hypothetical protein